MKSELYDDEIRNNKPAENEIKNRKIYSGTLQSQGKLLLQEGIAFHHYHIY